MCETAQYFAKFLRKWKGVEYEWARQEVFILENYTQHTAKHSTEQHGVSLFSFFSSLSFFAIKKILSYFFIQ